MAETGFFRYRNIGIIVVLFILALFALWIRVLPLFGPGVTDILNLVGSDDPLYNLRQIETDACQFPWIQLV